MSNNKFLVSGEKWDLLFGKNYSVPGETPPDFWRNVVVDIDFHPWLRQIAGSRQPTPAELKELGERALLVIRPSLPIGTPVAPKKDQGAEKSGDRTAKFNLNILFDIHRLSADGPESIIGVFSESGGGTDGRVIYGEYREGKPVFLWDSPLITGIQVLAYRDVKGYGSQDIVLSAEPSCGNRTCTEALVVFTKDGEELTRQWIGRPNDSCQDGFACPIIGGTFRFIHQGTQIPERIEVEWAEDHQPNDVYLLENGIFNRQPAAESPSVPDPSALNEQGKDLMKEMNFEAAAAKFVEAANRNPKSAEFANNAGFAYYKMRKYEESVFWLKKTIEIDPGRGIAYVNLGDSYVKLNKNAEARQAYTRCLEHAPNLKFASDVKKKLEALPTQ